MDLGGGQYRADQLGLGALGIVLKLGLMETIAVIVLGNIVGCAIFAAFTVMGHKTGVNQMVLCRSAFGRRGAYLPSALMFLLYRDSAQSAYGDINWGGIAAFVAGLIAGWSVEDGLVPALQGPVSTKLLGGADLSWLVGIVVAGAVYLALSPRPVTAAVPRPVGSR